MEYKDQFLFNDSFFNTLFLLFSELESRRADLDGEVFDLLFTLTDFLAFKEMMIDYKIMKNSGALDELLSISRLWCHITKWIFFTMIILFVSKWSYHDTWVSSKNTYFAINTLKDDIVISAIVTIILLDFFIFSLLQ